MTPSRRTIPLAWVTVAALGAAFVTGGCASTQEGAQGQPQSNTGQYFDDATVTAKVKTAIASDAGVRAAANVNVETFRGIVQLSGFADSEEQASRAVEAARKVAGVRSVRNDIRIKSSASGS